MENRRNETDSPLKRLVQMAPRDFAEWLLKTDVVAIESANIEIQPNPSATYTDLVFWVTVKPKEEEKPPGVRTDSQKQSENRLLLHIEFQGPSSERPMRLRVLDYIVGFAEQERGTRIHSVVFYVGEKTNITDTGHHQVMGIGERVTLAWQYDIVRLWTLDAEKLLAEGRPALLPLLGQAKLERPQEIIPLIYQAIRSVPEQELQHRLLIELLALLRDEEIIQMIEKMMEQDEWVLDTPYLRRWRQRIEDARREEREELSEEFQQEREIWNNERETLYQERELLLETQRQSTLKLTALRYSPSLEEYLRLQKVLSAIGSIEKLKAISESVLDIEDFGQFYLVVEKIINASNDGSLVVS